MGFIKIRKTMKATMKGTIMPQKNHRKSRVFGLSKKNSRQHSL